ncbi:MAG: sodium-translocating pyrophosphatase [Candidatus Njordarchaeales archaeon]
MIWLILGLGASLSAIFIAFFLAFYVIKQDPGTGRILEIANAIQEGARAFLKVQNLYLGLFVVVMAAVLAVFIHPNVAIAYVIGAICSMIAGVIGMETAVRANVRTTNLAKKKGLLSAYRIAYFGGSVMGFMVVGIALAGITMLYAIYNSFEVLLGFSFGASAVALFTKAGGGIYTKTADIAADLVGKVELGLPEDDPRNPAVIADNVGDNVGDVAGMASDLYDSYVASIIAAMVIGFEMYIFGKLTVEYIFLPIVIAGAGILASIIALVIANLIRSNNPGLIMNLITLIAVGSYIVLLYLIINWLGVSIAAFYATIAGLLAGAIMGLATDYYTSIDRGPVRKIAEASVTGTAINILMGFSYGTLSIIPGIIGVSAAMLVAWYVSLYFGLYPIYGIAIAAIGMLGIVGTIVSADAYGPIADNAKGIAEQAGLEEDVIRILDRLDAVGNTTKAITKGFAIGAAALTVLALFAAYAELVDIKILLDSPNPVTIIPIKILNLVHPNIVAGLLIGAMMPPVIAALLILAVAKNTEVMIEDIRKQVKERPGILEGTEKPDYARCVGIAERGALKELLPSGILAIIAPILTGIFLGVRALAAFLAGSIITGFIYALFMANSGGAWDNAKKFIEEGHFGGKGSEAHKAAVTGDTVGDPFKDTAGPTLNTMITVMSLVASTFAPLILQLALFP